MKIWITGCCCFLLWQWCRVPRTKKYKSLLSLIDYYYRTKSDVEIQDVYKLLYQGVFGVAHILNRSARQVLEQELDLVLPSDVEPLLEPVSIDKQVVRVNLRSFKFRGGTADCLWQVMLKSADEIQSSEEYFLTLWHQCGKLIGAGKSPFSLKDWKQFDQKMQAAGYPAAHHSEVYVQVNKPAYRVVKRRIFENLCILLKE